MSLKPMEMQTYSYKIDLVYLFRLVSKDLCDISSWLNTWTSQVALMVKNLSANSGDARDMGSNPGLEDPWK